MVCLHSVKGEFVNLGLLFLLFNFRQQRIKQEDDLIFLLITHLIPQSDDSIRIQLLP